MGINVLLTGDIQVGKTTICQSVVELARQWGYNPKGLLTPPIFDEDGMKVGIELVDVDTSERRLLARADCKLDGPQVGRYSFDAEVLAWGRSILERAMKAGCDLLVVDEIGYLELEQNRGFSAVLKALQAGSLTRTIIVVRSRLVERLHQLLPQVDCIAFTVTEENRDALPLAIAERIFDDRGR